MKKIRVTIRKDGSQRIEVLGARGEECLSFTEALEGRLGEPRGDRQLKPEFDDEETRLREAEPERQAEGE